MILIDKRGGLLNLLLHQWKKILLQILHNAVPLVPRCGAMLSIWREKRQQNIKQDSSEKSCQNVVLHKSEFDIPTIVISNIWDTGGCKQRN